MTQWKDNHEKRIPFMARGNGRIRDLDQKVEELAEKVNTQLKIMPVREMPAHPDDHMAYLIYEDDSEIMQ